MIIVIAIASVLLYLLMAVGAFGVIRNAEKEEDFAHRDCVIAAVIWPLSLCVMGCVVLKYGKLI